MKRHYIKWTNEDVSILKTHYNNRTPKEISKLFPNRKWLNILKKANDIGLKLKSIHTGNILGKTSNLLEDDEITYYWIGFILADAHITSNNRLVVSLSNVDKTHLDKFRKFLELPKKSLKVKDTYSYIAIMDNFNIKLLKEKFSLFDKKTYNPPILDYYESLPDNLFISLLIGFIDGDGCIRIRNNTTIPVITIKNHKSWTNFQQLILDKLNKFHKHNAKTHIAQQKYSYICISQRQLINFLKQKAIEFNLPYLKRKWNKVPL